MKTYNHICCSTLETEESDKRFKAGKKKEEIQVLLVQWRYYFHGVNISLLKGGWMLNYSVAALAD